jgi:hypothetical protein
MRNKIASFLQRYGLTVLIALFILAVIGVIGWETGWARYWSPGVPKLDGAARKADEIALLPPFTLPPVDPTYKETVERPLFNQTRRPNPPALATAPAAPAMEKGKYRLTGTAVNNELSAAFLVDNRTGKTYRVSRGGVVDPFGTQPITLDAVQPTSVTLKFGGDTETLALSTSKSPTAVAQALPQGQPPQPGVQPAGMPQAPSAPGQPLGGGALPVPVPAPAGGQTSIYGPGGAFATGPRPPEPGAQQAVPFPAPGNAAAAPTPATATPTPPTDQQPTTLRRRRFQNLPQ